MAGDSRVAGRVVVEAFFPWGVKGRDGLEVLVMESRILWNFRFVVLSATGILSGRISFVFHLARLESQIEVAVNQQSVKVLMNVISPFTGSFYSATTLKYNTKQLSKHPQNTSHAKTRAQDTRQHFQHGV